MKISISLSASSAILAGASLVAAAPQSSTYNVGATQPDYVIIGGGPAGFVLAEQLSRNPEKTVVLLEAGSENANVKEIDVPGLGPQLLQTQHTWNFSSQPDPNLGGEMPPSYLISALSKQGMHRIYTRAEALEGAALLTTSALVAGRHLSLTNGLRSAAMKDFDGTTSSTTTRRPFTSTMCQLIMKRILILARMVMARSS